MKIQTENVHVTNNNNNNNIGYVEYSRRNQMPLFSNTFSKRALLFLFDTLTFIELRKRQRTRVIVLKRKFRATGPALHRGQ